MAYLKKSLNAWRSPGSVLAKVERKAGIIPSFCLLLVIAAISLLLGAQSVVLVRTQHAPKQVLLVLDHSSVDFSAYNNLEVFLNGKLSIKDGDDKDLRSFLSSFSQLQTKDQQLQLPALLISRGKLERAEAITQETQIAAVLKTMVDRESASRPPAIALAMLLGIVAGAIVVPKNTFQLFGLSCAIVACLYKAMHPCPVCPFVKLLGLPIEVTALVSYFSVTILLALRPLTISATILSILLCTGACAVQLHLSLTSREICFPCLTVASINGFMVCSLAMRSRVHSLTALPIIQRIAIPALTLIVALPLVVHETSDSTKGSAFSSHPTYLTSLRGERVSVVGLSVPPKGRQAVAILSDTCQACNLEREWLLDHPSLPIRVVRLLPPGKVAHTADELTYDPNTPLSLPVTLFIENGVVRSQTPGWSDDFGWQTTLESEIQNYAYVKAKESP